VAAGSRVNTLMGWMSSLRRLDQARNDREMRAANQRSRLLLHTQENKE